MFLYHRKEIDHQRRQTRSVCLSGLGDPPHPSCYLDQNVGGGGGGSYSIWIYE